MTAILICLLTKHFLADFVLQTQWMTANKHDILHPGGYAHAAIHGIGTALILGYFGAPFELALLDAGSHYLIDFTKANLTRNWMTDHPGFWIALGLDQYLHGLIYIFVATKSVIC